MTDNRFDEATSPDLDTKNSERSAFARNRAQNQVGVAVGLTTLAPLLTIASFALIWFGGFPRFIATSVAVSWAVFGVRLIGQSNSATSVFASTSLRSQ